MYSSEYPERFYFQYQTEVGPLGIILSNFLLKFLTVAETFGVWYRKI